MPLAFTNKAVVAIKIISIAIFFAVMPGFSSAATVARIAQAGVVTRVIDGDTVWVQLSGRDKPLKVRLQGIDAPEICQSGGVRAQAALSAWIKGQSVIVTTRAHDDFGRTVGTLYVKGQDVARQMVADGHAWVYTFRSKKGAYSSEFARAQTERRGVFADAQPQQPRLFRKMHGACLMSAYRPTK